MRKIIMLLIFSSLTVCANSSYEEQHLPTDPLVAYRKGHYRYVAEYFEKHGADTLEFQYTWASSYVELREYKKAFDQFYKINAEDFYKAHGDLFPFYIRRYMQAIRELDTPDILTPEEEKNLLGLVAKVPKDSPVRSYLDNELFSVLWTAENYETMLLLKDNLSQQGRGWLELAKFQLGLDYNVNDIIRAQRSFAKNKAYSNIIDTLEPKNFRNSSDLSNLVEMSLRLDEYRDKALAFAERYTYVTKDREYYARILATKLQLEKNHKQATEVLVNYARSNSKISLGFYTYIYDFLNKQKEYDLADEIADRAYQVYQKEFYKKADIAFNKNPKFILQWYKDSYKTLSQEQHLQAIRALIRLDLKLAEQATEFGLEHNKNHPSFLLLYALIKEHFDKKEEAYRYYLQLMFQEPFGYSGIVSKQKEITMREEYRPLFDEKATEMIALLPKQDLKNRLMLAKAFLVDDELAQYVDKKQLKKDQEDFNKIVYKDLNSVKAIPILEKYPSTLKNFAPETQDYVENAIIDAMRLDKNTQNSARYYYKYRDILIDSDIEGYLTFRLYFYVRDMHGYTYLPNYPKEVVDLIFPKPEFDLITEWSGNQELAYWMLSSFMAESHFRKRVYSTVGAVGFAQVMPYTAKDIKVWLKKPYLSNYDFYDNMRMGVYYHKKMYEERNKNVLLSLAAYNAGPTAVSRWQRNYKHIKDIFLFVEAIDYKETRNYIKIINYNHGMYRLLNDYDLYQ